MRRAQYSVEQVIMAVLAILVIIGGLVLISKMRDNDPKSPLTTAADDSLNKAAAIQENGALPQPSAVLTDETLLVWQHNL